MKIRSDFVSNSSSSSYIIYFPEYDEKFSKVQAEIDKELEKIDEMYAVSWDSHTEHPFTGRKAPDEDGEWQVCTVDSNGVNYDFDVVCKIR